MQGVKDQVSSLLGELQDAKTNSETILEKVRKAAAERGVSQEAYHFSQQAEHHEQEATKWQRATIWTAIGLGCYGVATLFLHKIPILAPADVGQSIQFTVSKVLVFAVLAYMLGLCARNFLSHRHNQIVNTHRQNALMTFQSLVSAGSLPESRDIVLQQAAAAIYQMHDTGYTKGTDTGKPTLVDVVPRATIPVSTVASSGTP